MRFAEAGGRICVTGPPWNPRKTGNLMSSGYYPLTSSPLCAFGSWPAALFWRWPVPLLSSACRVGPGEPGQGKSLAASFAYLPCPPIRPPPAEVACFPVGCVLVAARACFRTTMSKGVTEGGCRLFPGGGQKTDRRFLQPGQRRRMNQPVPCPRIGFKITTFDPRQVQFSPS